MELLVASESGNDTSGPNSPHPPEPSNVETHDDEGHSSKKSNRRILPLIGHLALIHLPPVAVTSAVLSLYIADVRWKNPTNNALNALQFAAKIHEALIILSLADILMGRINYHLSNKGDSLPLGFLASPLLLNSPFLYLISSELWSPILSSGVRDKRHKITGVMILLTAVLCIAASPLSAITMIPRQGWRLNLGGDGRAGFRTTYTPGTLYYTDLDAEAVPDADLGAQSTRPSQMSILETGISRRTAPLKGPFENSTYANYGSTRRPMSYKTDRPGAVATCPLSAITRHMGNVMYGFDRSDELVKAGNKADESSVPTKWKQPLVSAECSSSVLVNGTAEFFFGPKPYLSQAVEIHDEQHPWILNVTRNISNSARPLGYSFLNLKETKNLQISTDMIFATLVNETTGDDGYPTPLRPVVVQLTLCLISARWTEADVWLEAGRTGDALSHFNFPNEEEVTQIRQSFGTEDFINIGEDWMAGIASLPNTSANRTAYEEAMDFCSAVPRPLILDSSCLQTFLAMHVTDAIAELGEFQQYKLTTWVRSNANANSLTYTGYVYVYSYEFGSSIGIPIAFSILLLHVLVVIIYAVLLFCSKHRWYKAGWSSLGDLLVLTLDSDVTVDLTKGKAAQKWTKPVVVREVDDTGRKGIVVQDDGKDVGQV